VSIELLIQNMFEEFKLIFDEQAKRIEIFCLFLVTPYDFIRICF